MLNKKQIIIQIQHITIVSVLDGEPQLIRLYVKRI